MSIKNLFKAKVINFTKKIATVQDRFDAAIYDMNDNILKLGDALSSLYHLQDIYKKTDRDTKSIDEKIKTVENKIREYGDKIEKVKSKRDELLSRLNIAQQEASIAKNLKKTKLSDLEFSSSSILEDCEKEIEKLEAEAKADTFISSL